MTQKYSRAQRRADYARLKEKRQFHWGYGHKDEWAGRTPENAGEINYMSPHTAGFVANTPTPCSCWMCRNPRHAGFSYKETVTRQELKADDRFKDDLQYWLDYEYYDWKYMVDWDWISSEDWYDQIWDEDYENWLWARARGWVD